MKAATVLTSKGQVVIPKALRERLRWRPGKRLAVEELAGGAVRLSPAPDDDDFAALLKDLRGCLKGEGPDPLDELEAEHRAEVQEDERGRRRR
jgi:AbrB family looped-hinge helix DNA binding protein